MLKHIILFAIALLSMLAVKAEAAIIQSGPAIPRHTETPAPIFAAIPQRQIRREPDGGKAKRKK